MNWNADLHSTGNENWDTPQWLFDKLNDKYHFTLDPCASDENHKCALYFTKKEDGLSKSWEGHTVFVNPPYGRPMQEWIKKSYYESLKPNTRVVMLIPARTDTEAFHDYILPYASVIFFRGRIKFGDGENPAPFPSMLAIFPKLGPCNK